MCARIRNLITAGQRCIAPQYILKMIQLLLADLLLVQCQWQVKKTRAGWPVLHRAPLIMGSQGKGPKMLIPSLPSFPAMFAGLCGHGSGHPDGFNCREYGLRNEHGPGPKDSGNRAECLHQPLLELCRVQPCASEEPLPALASLAVALLDGSA